MSKSPDAFRTISEVAEWLGVQAHVLRFWESKFTQVKPVKRAGGRRYYRPADMRLLGGIKKLLHDDGMTIKGAQKLIREQGVQAVSSLSQPLESEQADDVIEATVIDFRHTPEPAPVAAPEPVAETPPETPGPAEPEPETPDAEAPEETPEPVTETATDAAPEPVEEEAPAAANPRLPSFLHRPAETAAPPAAEPETAPESPPEPAPEPVDAGPRPRIIDAPDPPPEDAIEVAASALSHAFAMRRMPMVHATRIAPVLAELEGWLDRNRGARPG